MKVGFKIFLYVVILTSVWAINSHAGWKLYDDFSSLTINTDKWIVDNSSANITIESGEVKFYHQENHPNDSSWLQIADNPQSILGIKAKIRVQSCVNGDVRGRIGGYSGTLGDKFIWSAIQVRYDRGRVEASSSLLTANDDYLYDLFFAAFKHNYAQPFNITNQSFVLEWIRTNNGFIAKSDGQGEIVYEHDGNINLSEYTFKGIGTRSSNGDGPCTIYFDDVYVYRQTPSVAPNMLLLED